MLSIFYRSIAIPSKCSKSPIYEEVDGSSFNGKSVVWTARLGEKTFLTFELSNINISSASSFGSMAV